MAKKRKLDPNRFSQPDGQSFFTFDPIRKNLFKWGVIAGAAGGYFMLRPEILWQIAGVFVVVVISNYHINKASRRIPRWHATLVSFLGAMLGIAAIVAFATLLAYLAARSGA